MAKGNRRMSAADEAAVVMALAKGATIGAAAREVGFSARTLHRRRRASALFGEAWAAAVAESARPVLVARAAGRGWQVRRMRRNRFTRERKAVFLEHLSATCNATQAAAAAGICLWTAYDHRRRDSAFGQGWEEALRIGLPLLEAEALRQRIAAMERIRFEVGEPGTLESAVERDLEFWRTLHLLRLNRTGWTGGRRGRPPSVAALPELHAALVRRLADYGIRIDEEDGDEHRRG